uniref:Uncharacterized protein n=1 Tax=Acrobeloides nanus TaxID=290746 RepID=A0A914BXZ0_9BILA
MKIEVLASYGMSKAMLSTAKQAIIKHFTHNLYMSGIEADRIGEDLEDVFGGLWAVYNYDIDYDIAYTIVRRSPSYVLFQVDDRGMLLARDGFPDPPEGGYNRPLI